MIDPRERRKRAAEACRARFHQKPYKPGVRDCPLLALHDLRHVGVSVPFAKGLKWKDETEGLRILKGLGFSNLYEALDSLGLPRIAPAMARTADLVALPTTHKLGALSVFMGNGAHLGFHDLSPNAEIITNLTEFVRDDLGPCAWRVIDG
ncbi:hypothetical protein GCM10017620_24580 [Brevundimonas intermedia]|uniref:DUF6950 domain-containing protein n=1 Tax=Brevundimonas intermedia TaxID=74315 RepID=A0ABQ5TBI5_9CAUL|nr:hypothetical protein [Brevundimonas intermedia]GLK49485.1 hypothetical protein GCM10017620_24580 [Brevundimonas intermedia]